MDQYTRGRDENPIFVLLGKPDYYDSPEGKNPWEKIWGLSKYAIPTAMFMSTNDALFFSQVRNMAEAANVMGFWMIPLLGLSTAFTTITYIATNMRGKDDKINYACGALACGPVLHAWRKSTSFTCWGIAILMAAAILKKDSVQKGWEFFPSSRRQYGNYVYDFSLTEEWPRRPI